MRDTIEMAREAGLLTWLKPPEDVIERFKSFDALVRADEREQGQKWFDAVTAQHRVMILAEREACAKLCDRVVGGTNPDDIHSDSQWAAFSLAQAIRARGETND
jgi:hypothetical protein